MESPEKLTDRLFHLGYLGEEMAGVLESRRDPSWLFRQIAREALAVVREASEYVAQFEEDRARNAACPVSEVAEGGSGGAQ